MFKAMLTLAMLLGGVLGCSDAQQPHNNEPVSGATNDPKLAAAGTDKEELQWMQYDMENSGRSMRVLIRPDAGIIDDRLATVVIVAWPYEVDKASQPAPAVKARMEEMEKLLLPVSDRDQSSRLLMTVVGAGRAEWVFYVKDYPQFEVEFNDLTKGHSPFPIEVSFSKDADWSYVHRMQARILTKIESVPKVALPPSELKD